MSSLIEKWDKSKAKLLGEVLPVQTLREFKQVVRVEVYDGSRTDFVWDWIHRTKTKANKTQFIHLDHGGTLRLAMLLLKAYQKILGVEDLEAIFFTLRKLFDVQERVE